MASFVKRASERANIDFLAVSYSASLRDWFMKEGLARSLHVDCIDSFLCTSVGLIYLTFHAHP